MFPVVLQLLLKLNSLTSTSKLFYSSTRPQFQVLLLQHAVATPIAVLLASVNELEKQQLFENTELKKTRMAVRQLQTITEALCSLPRRNKRCNVKNVVKTVVTLLRSKQHNIIFTDVSSDAGVYTVRIQEIRFQEALTCVINNALVANELSGLPVHITYYKEKSRFRITIRDFGPGMNQLLQSLAHLPLFSLKSYGRGLGLPFAKHVIEEELKGSLRIFSQPNYGTLVECIIPTRI